MRLARLAFGYHLHLLHSGSALFRREGDEDTRAKYRTECWLERCMFEERICAPEEHVAFAPLAVEAPISGTEDMVISYSGLDQSEACWIRRLLRALGTSPRLKQCQIVG